MSEFGYENQAPSTKPWKIYTTSNVPTSWKTGAETTSSSMNAVSFGFVATAILISLFLIMAILEHLFRPTSANSNNLSSVDVSSSESGSKLRIHQQNETTSYKGGVLVLMPGEKFPTCIAKPAPIPCPRQGFHWPSYQNTFSFS